VLNPEVEKRGIRRPFGLHKPALTTNTRWRGKYLQPADLSRIRNRPLGSFERPESLAAKFCIAGSVDLTCPNTAPALNRCTDCAGMHAARLPSRQKVYRMCWMCWPPRRLLVNSCAGCARCAGCFCRLHINQCARCTGRADHLTVPINRCARCAGMPSCRTESLCTSRG
jgi:hypothetical protein